MLTGGGTVGSTLPEARGQISILPRKEREGVYQRVGTVLPLCVNLKLKVEIGN